MLERKGLDLLGHRAQKRAAVLAIDLPVGLEFLKVLSDGGLRNAEGCAQVANPRAAFFLQPGKDFHAARFGEEPIEVGIQPDRPDRRASPFLKPWRSNV